MKTTKDILDSVFGFRINRKKKFTLRNDLIIAMGISNVAHSSFSKMNITNNEDSQTT